MTMQTTDLMSVLKASFDSCEIVDGSTARCEHRFNGRLRSVVFVNAMDSVPGAEEVEEIQTRVVAPSYFASRDESRWNHYLVFVVPGSLSPQDTRRRYLIEKDTSYARKLVVPYAELDSFLKRGAGRELIDASNANLLQQAWSDALRKGGLGAVDSDEPRTSVLRAIRAGNSMDADRTQRPLTDTLPLSFLSEFRVKQFGSRSLKGEFTFGRVNLIRGVNGAGKTSLLEAIEHFLCGATARGKGAENLSASATFTNSEREISFQQKPLSYYQQRDLKWYGRKATQKSRLCDGFARYNFLSADAAVDFSREEDQHDLTTVLSRVALGPEAGFTWDRIQQVYGDIGPHLGSLQREVAALESRLEKVDARLAALNLPAPEASSRSAYLVALLARAGWKVSSETLTTPKGFQQVAGLRLLLDSVPDSLPATIQLVRDELHESESSLEKIRRIEAAQRVNDKDRAEMDDSLKAVGSLKRCVTRLKEYANVRFAQLAADIAEVNRDEPTALPSRDAISQLLTEIERAELSKAGSTGSLAETGVTLKAEIASLQRVIEEASAAFEAQSSRLVERGVLTAQLRSLGLKLAKEHPNDGCPLCHTNMSAAILIERIQGSMVNDDSAHLAAMEEGRRRLLNRLSLLLNTQGLLDSVVQTFPRTAGIPIRTIVSMIDESDAEMARKAAARSALLASMEGLHNDGFRQQEFLGLLARCEAEIHPDFNTSNLSQDLLLLADGHVEARRDAIVRKQWQCMEKAKELNASLMGFSSAETSDVDVVSLKFAFARRGASLRKFASAFADLPAEVQRRGQDNLQLFVDFARMTYSHVTALSEDLRENQAKSLEVVSLNEESRALSQILLKLKSECSNLKSAHGVLEGIISDHSLEKGLSDFLSSNLNSIQSIFQRIHVPNELRLSNLSGCELIRAADGSPTSLSQISTGQRAALVLSVFLTLNMSLRSGPPMMLVDDPIAHVDDINSLAFLDYLADIAEGGKRQIFFATADEKLANLFEKKMAFMDRHFKVIPLERSVAEGETNH